MQEDGLEPQTSLGYKARIISASRRKAGQGPSRMEAWPQGPHLPEARIGPEAVASCPWVHASQVWFLGL